MGKVPFEKDRQRPQVTTVISGLVMTTKHHDANHVGASVLDDIPVSSEHLRVAHENICRQVPLASNDVSVVQRIRQTALIQKENEARVLRICPNTKQCLSGPRIPNAENTIGTALMQLPQACVRESVGRVQYRP